MSDQPIIPPHLRRAVKNVITGAVIGAVAALVREAGRDWTPNYPHGPGGGKWQGTINNERNKPRGGYRGKD